MRIAFDAKRAFNNLTGLGNYSRSLILSLENSFAENDYFLFTPKVNEAISDSFQQYSKIILPEKLLHKLIPAYWRSWGLAAQVQQNKIDIFHGLSNELPFNAQHFKCKKIVSIHDLLYMKYPEDFPAFDRFFYARKTKHASEIADTITVNSSQTKEDLMQFLNIAESKIVVIPHTISKDFFSVKNEQEIADTLRKYHLPANYILQTGSFLKRKNHSTSIQAFSKIAQKHQNLFLVLLTNGGNYEKVLMQQIISLNLQSKILVVKNVDACDMPAIYQAARLVLYPSIDEGFGLPILEAFASGVPVITSHQKVFLETGGDAAFYADTQSISAFENAIETLLEDDNKRSLLIANGKRQISKFSQEKLAENTMKLYQKISS